MEATEVAKGYYFEDGKNLYLVERICKGGFLAENCQSGAIVYFTFAPDELQRLRLARGTPTPR